MKIQITNIQRGHILYEGSVLEELTHEEVQNISGDIYSFLLSKGIIAELKIEGD